MGIRFHCPNGHKLNVKSFLAGKRGICPKCGVGLNIPLESETAAASASPRQVHDQLADAETVGAAAGTAGHYQGLQFSGNTAGGSERAGFHTPHPAEDVAGSFPETPPNGTPAPYAAIPADTLPSLHALPVSLPPTDPVSQPASYHQPASYRPDPLADAPTAMWYVRPPSGGQFGPARGEIVRQWIDEGRVSADTLVWRDGWSQWQSAGNLFPGLGMAATDQDPAPTGGFAPTMLGGPATAPGTPEGATSASPESPTRPLRRRRGNGLAITLVSLLGVVSIGLLVALYYVMNS